MALQSWVSSSVAGDLTVTIYPGCVEVATLRKGQRIHKKYVGYSSKEAQEEFVNELENDEGLTE